MPLLRTALILVLATGVALPQSVTTLRQAAAYRTLLVGAAADADEFGISPSRLLEPDYAATLSTQYNMLEPENAMKWNPIHPTQSTYDFEPGDQLVAFAQAHGMKTRGHNLCWGVFNPDWLVNGGFSSTALSQILQDHIKTVVSHYQGQVFAWDVVNEAVSDSASGVGTDLKDSIWYNQPGIGLTGTGFIEQAFRWAHAADPAALLFYNDYNIEQDGPKFEAVYNMLKDFVSRGVPINGLGIQMHIDSGSSYPDLSQLASDIARVASLGLQVHITEMDVKIPSSSFSDQTVLMQQAATYSNILTVCLQNPACTAFQTWGFTDKYSWIPGANNNQYGNALPFDANYQPKPAFNSMMQTLQTVPAPSSANAIVNASNYTGGGVAPGEIITMFQTNFGPPAFTGTQLDSSLHLLTNLAGTEVLFDGAPAPVLYTVAGQTSVVVPYEVSGHASTAITYKFNGIASAPVTLPVVAAAPGIFSINASGTGPGAILNYVPSNGGLELNTSSSPISSGGTIVLFATGGGQTSPASVDGQLAPGAAIQLLNVTATVAGVVAPVSYAGAAPGEVNGLMQVNLQIPTAVSSGPQEVIISVNGVASQRGLTVAVQ